jgi:hypothetical protein
VAGTSRPKAKTFPESDKLSPNTESSVNPAVAIGLPSIATQQATVATIFASLHEVPCCHDVNGRWAVDD